MVDRDTVIVKQGVAIQKLIQCNTYKSVQIAKLKSDLKFVRRLLKISNSINHADKV